MTAPSDTASNWIERDGRCTRGAGNSGTTVLDADRALAGAIDDLIR